MSELPPDRDEHGRPLGEGVPPDAGDVGGPGGVGPPGDTGVPGEPATPDLGPPGPEGPEEGLIETCVSVITSPVATLRRVTTTQPLGWAIAVIVVAGIASGIANAADPDPFGIQDGGGDLGAGWVVFSPIFNLIIVAIGTAVVLLTSKMLDGGTTYKALFVGFGFASVPSVFNVLGGVFGAAGAGALAGLITIATGIWGLVLGVIAVREANRFSTGRAIGAVVLAGVGLAIVGGIIVAIFAALFVSAFRGVG